MTATKIISGQDNSAWFSRSYKIKVSEFWALFQNDCHRTGVRHSLTMKKLLLEFGIIQIIGLIFKLTLCVCLLLVYKRLQSFS